MGGHLVTITSAEKSAFILNFISEYRSCFWLGASYDEQENTWKWVTGENWNYTNWDDEDEEINPNNPGDSIYASQSPDTDKWTCEGDNATNPIICEWDKEIEPINFTNLLFAVQSDGTLALSGICDEVTSSTPLTLDTWQHVLLRFSQGYCTLYLDGVQVLGAEMSGDVLTSEVQLGGYVGYMDEFVFRASAGSGTPKIPAAPYNATFDVGLVGGFGTGSDGDVTISANSYINSYGLINSITDNKTFSVASWNNGTIHDMKSYFNGHTFKYFSTTKTWTDAKAYCEELGGHLATSTSAEKNDFLRNLSGTATTWLGGTDENSEGNWEWVTGEEWDYTNWYSGQPDNSGDNQHYAALKSNAKTWSDNANTSKYGFICEWDYIIDDIFGTELMLHITAPTSTTSGYYPNVGLYAFSKIASIDGNNVVLEDDITTENGFDFTLNSDLLSTYYVQAITVPHFKTFTINSGTTVTPLSWNTTTGGGIVAFRCKGDCTINGSIITHGKGAVRYDYCQMENSKLIDRFLCAQGGGIFITCGGTFTTSENARLGATWSGEGDGSNGAAGKGGNSGAISNNKISPNLGGVGGGGGGSACYSANVSIGGSVGSSSPATSHMGAGGGGCGGNGSSTTYPRAPGGSGGGGQGNSGGKAGTGGTNGSSGEKGTINGGNTVIGSGTNYSALFSGAGGGGPGGNGGSGYRSQNANNYGPASRGIAGASLVLLCKILNATIASISTGGSSGEIVYYNDAVHMGAPGGA